MWFQNILHTLTLSHLFTIWFHNWLHIFSLSPLHQIWFQNSLHILTLSSLYHLWFQKSLHITALSSLYQIWFQNRRAKWRKHSRLRNFGGLQDLTEVSFVPAPKPDHEANAVSKMPDSNRLKLLLIYTSSF